MYWWYNPLICVCLLWPGGKNCCLYVKNPVGRKIVNKKKNFIRCPNETVLQFHAWNLTLKEKSRFLEGPGVPLMTALLLPSALWRRYSFQSVCEWSIFVNWTVSAMGIICIQRAQFAPNVCILPHLNTRKKQRSSYLLGITVTSQRCISAFTSASRIAIYFCLIQVLLAAKNRLMDPTLPKRKKLVPVVYWMK